MTFFEKVLKIEKIMKIIMVNNPVLVPDLRIGIILICLSACGLLCECVKTICWLSSLV
jgi:hypothetical protein